MKCSLLFCLVLIGVMACHESSESAAAIGNQVITLGANTFQSATGYYYQLK